MNNSSIVSSRIERTWPALSKRLRHWFMHHGENEDVQDLLQQVAMRLIYAESRRGFEDNNHFISYAYKTASSVLIDAGRKRCRSISTSSSSLEDGEFDYPAEDDLESELDAKQKIFQAISTMSIREKEIFNLTVIEGYDTDEAAKIMNISEATARSHLRFARLRIKVAWLS